ncbi:MAG: hypothetical protein GX320_09430 [Tissierellia bacterium]|nr:hypothetical protein [Tissierellia bacterium]
MVRKMKHTIQRIENKIEKFIICIEALLALLIIVTVVLGLKDLVAIAIAIFKTEANYSYEILQRFLSHTLLLVVGIELALMLISHTPGRVLQVTLYAIARKMLISSSNMADILLGVLALAIVFLIDKFLHTRDTKKVL